MKKLLVVGCLLTEQVIKLFGVLGKCILAAADSSL